MITIEKDTMKFSKLLPISFVLAIIIFSQFACAATSPASWPPTPDTGMGEQAKPTWTAVALSPDASPTPTPTMTPAVPPEPVLTPTPDYPSIALALQPVFSGQGVPEAAAYDPGGPGPHPVTLLSTSGAAYTQEIEGESIGGYQYTTIDNWNTHLPTGWSTASLSEVELVVVIGDEREYALESAQYVGGQNQSLTVTAYRFETDIELREAHTGKTLAVLPFSGSDPRPFPERWGKVTNRLEGSHFTYVLLEGWLCQAVTSQVCLAPLDPHLEQPVWSIYSAFSPDGQVLAAADSNINTVQLWGASDNSLLRTLEGHTGGVTSFAFSPDGQTLASGSYDSSVRLWQVSDGAILGILQGGSDWINRVAFSPDGQTLFSVSSPDGSITSERNLTTRLWRIADGTVLRTLEKQDYYTATPVYAPDGQTLAVVADSTAVQLWQTADGALLRTLEGGTKPVDILVFSPDGQILASSSFGEPTRLWQVSDGSLLRTLEEQADSVDSVAFSPDGQILITQQNYAYTVQFWRVSDGTLMATLKGETDLAGGTAFSPDGQVLLTWQYNTLQLWRVADGMLLVTLAGSETASVANAAFAPDGQTLVSVAVTSGGSDDETETTVQLWRVADGALLRTLISVKGDAAIRAAFSPDGQTLAIRNRHAVELWRLTGSPASLPE
jgi:WD40 repeat protein